MFFYKPFTLLQFWFGLNSFQTDPSSIDSDQSLFTVHRAKGALNHFETIQVENKGDKIIYRSTKGRLEYDLEFQIESGDSLTQVMETLFVDTEHTKIPIKLLAPIAKHAFSENLSNLGRIIESQTVK